MMVLTICKRKKPCLTAWFHEQSKCSKVFHSNEMSKNAGLHPCSEFSPTNLWNSDAKCSTSKQSMILPPRSGMATVPHTRYMPLLTARTVESVVWPPIRRTSALLYITIITCHHHMSSSSSSSSSYLVSKQHSSSSVLFFCAYYKKGGRFGIMVMALVKSIKWSYINVNVSIYIAHQHTDHPPP